MRNYLGRKTIASFLVLAPIVSTNAGCAELIIGATIGLIRYDIKKQKELQERQEESRYRSGVESRIQELEREKRELKRQINGQPLQSGNIRPDYDPKARNFRYDSNPGDSNKPRNFGEYMKERFTRH